MCPNILGATVFVKTKTPSPSCWKELAYTLGVLIGHRCSLLNGGWKIYEANVITVLIKLMHP